MEVAVDTVESNIRNPTSRSSLGACIGNMQDALLAINKAIGKLTGHCDCDRIYPLDFLQFPFDRDG